MFDTKNFGVYITAKRKSKGMKQTDLAECLHITRQSVSKYETGKCVPDISIIIQLADILNVTLDELIKSGIPP